MGGERDKRGDPQRDGGRGERKDGGERDGGGERDRGIETKRNRGKEALKRMERRGEEAVKPGRTTFEE